MGEVNLSPDIRDYLRQLEARIAEQERRGARVPTYTLATRPAASAVQAPTIIFVSDDVDGQRFQGSDGTNWKTLG